MTKEQHNKLIDEGIETINKIYNWFIYRYNLYSYMSKEDLEDMKQDAFIEMVHVIDNKFDLEKKNKLSTYLTPRITGFFKDYIKQHLQRKDINISLVLINETTSDEFIDSSINIDNLKIAQLKDMLNQLDISDPEIINDILNESCRYPELYEILQAMTCITYNTKIIILSYYFLDRSIVEIAKLLDLNPDTGFIYRIKRQGIQKLREELKLRGIL
jgi:RNA polymerase sigma factor (sigma-70 family)